MTLKIAKRPPRRKTKPRPSGWHSLDTNELALWVYMFLERGKNSRFEESVRPWAIRLHIDRTTLWRQLKALVRADVILADTKDRQDKTVYTVIEEPPEDVLGLAEAFWKVEALKGKRVPSGSHVRQAQIRVNTGENLVSKANGIATTNKSSNQQPVSSRDCSVVDVGNSYAKSIGASPVRQGQTRMDSGDSLVSEMNLSDSQVRQGSELQRLDEEIHQADASLADAQKAAKANLGNEDAWSLSWDQVRKLKDHLKKLRNRRDMIEAEREQ